MPDTRFRHFVDPPAGESYAGLLSAACDDCDTLLFVISRSRRFNELAFSRRLKAKLRDERLASTWPGTVRAAGSKPERVVRLDYDSSVAAVLAEASHSLFGLASLGIGDASLLSQDREWFVSIHHERLCWFVATAAEWEAIKRRVPGLVRYSTERL